MSMSDFTINTINHWAKADKNPAATLDKIKSDLVRRKQMVRINPMQVFKEVDYEGWKHWPEEIKYWRELNSYTGGWTPDRVMRSRYMIPQVLFNIDPDYWHEVIRDNKTLRHPEFLILDPRAKNYGIERTTKE